MNADPFGDGWMMRVELGATRRGRAAHGPGRVPGADRRLMGYSPHTAADRDQMLATIGVAAVDDLFADIAPRSSLPASICPSPFDRMEVRVELARLARHATGSPNVSFLGAGAYRHLVPSVVNEVIGRSKLSTSYPLPARGEPGDPAEHLRVPVAHLRADGNGGGGAPAHYDGATATAEAALMACRLTRPQTGWRCRSALSPPITGVSWRPTAPDRGSRPWSCPPICRWAAPVDGSSGGRPARRR